MKRMDDNLKDIFSREYNKDFPSLTTDEVKFLLQNIFYQYFLIDLTNINYNINIDEEGMSVKFILNGDAYKDPANLTKTELEKLTNEEEEDDE